MSLFQEIWKLLVFLFFFGFTSCIFNCCKVIFDRNLIWLVCKEKWKYAWKKEKKRIWVLNIVVYIKKKEGAIFFLG